MLMCRKNKTASGEIPFIFHISSNTLLFATSLITYARFVLNFGKKCELMSRYRAMTVDCNKFNCHLEYIQHIYQYTYSKASASLSLSKRETF